jgi:hypothetical protein
MSIEINIITCPSCGASPTNNKNCEFCGSLFVRYKDVKLDHSELFDNNSKFIGFIYPGLENELRKNLDLQTNSSFIITDIMHKGQVVLQIVQTSKLDLKLNGSPKSFPGIAIHVPFTEDRADEYGKFITIEESKLFQSSYSSEYDVHDFMIDFGNDSVGASYLASVYLIKQEGLPENTMLKYTTLDYNNTETNEKLKSSKCFIATATMGNYNHPVVIDLRMFRDNWLLKRDWGVRFTNWYYNHGPKAAKFIEKSHFLKNVSYIFIVKPLQLISKFLK